MRWCALFHRCGTLPARAAVAAALGAAATVAAPAAAQLGGRAEVVLASDYVWRGIATNRPELSASVHGWYAAHRSYVSAGIWGQGIPVGLADSKRNRMGRDPTDTVALRNEVDVWAEVVHRVGAVRMTGGAIYYFVNDFIADSGGTARPQRIPNTAEVYGRASLDLPAGALRLYPGVAASYDVDEIGGAYVETSLSARVPVFANVGTYGTLLLGWSAGQAVGGADDRGYFAGDGLAHVEASLAMSAVRIRSTTYAFSLHYQWATNRLKGVAFPETGHKLWFTLAMTAGL